MGRQHERSIWAVTVRRWLAGHVTIGPGGEEQLPLPGMPEPPEQPLVRAFYAVLADFADPGGVLSPGWVDLAQILNVSARTVARMVDAYKRAGLLTVVEKGRRGHRAVYQLALPAWITAGKRDTQVTPNRHGKHDTQVTPNPGESMTPDAQLHDTQVARLKGERGPEAPKGTSDPTSEVPAQPAKPRDRDDPLRDRDIRCKYPTADECRTPLCVLHHQQRRARA